MSNPQDFLLNTKYDMDKIIGIYTGSASAASRISPTPVISTTNTGVNDLVFFQGTFTIDGGEPYDIGTEVQLSGQTVQALGATTNGKLKIYVNNGDTVAHTIGYKVATLAKPSNTWVDLPTTNAPTNNFYLNTSQNYQKIAFEDTVSVSLKAASGQTPSDTIYSATHNLGYRPCVRAFVDNGATLTDALVRNGIALVYNIDVGMTNTVDSNTVVFRFTNNDTTTYSFNLSYRIYYDAG